MSIKVAQLTGENGNVMLRPPGCPAIRGTDLGSSFRHRGQFIFLFGDTHWVHHPERGTLDSVARTSQTNAESGLSLQFHCSFLEVIKPKISQGEYEVPLDGFSFKENMFVFFSTDYCKHYDSPPKHRKVMGHSVLTRCLETNPDFDNSHPNNPLQFQYLTKFSSSKFINVSVEVVEREQLAANHLPARQKGLLIWGTGAYRQDNIYLAFLDLDEDRVSDSLFATSEFPASQLGVLYFTGEVNGVPTWSAREEDAVPLFYPAAIGELSVRFNSKLERWVCMYGNGPEDPIGNAIVMRVARNPWGAWSRRRLVLDWVADDMGFRTGPGSQKRFIHNGLLPLSNDNPGDDIIDSANRNGAAYAAYQLPHHTSLRHTGFTLHYVLSTWNPYQVVQMRHEIEFWEFGALE